MYVDVLMHDFGLKHIYTENLTCAFLCLLVVVVVVVGFKANWLMGDLGLSLGESSNLVNCVS